MDSGVFILIIVVVAAALVGVAAFILRRRAEVESHVPTIADRSQVPLDLTNVPINTPPPAPPPSTDVLAVIEILEGPNAIIAGQSVGRQVEVHTKRMTIGRNPRQVDLQLYNLDEPSSVSRLHCTIEFHEGLHCFMITDEASSSGTRVDGRAIIPYQPHALKDNDVIELGLLQKEGAVLRFHTAFNPPDSPGGRVAIQLGIDAKDTLRQPIETREGRTTNPVRTEVFISYSRRDREKMRIIRDSLTASGLTVWSDENLEPGSQSWRMDVQAAIEGAGCVVALLSPEAKDSEWVSEELGYAKIRRLHIFTVLVRGDESNALPLGLTGVQWIDMRTDYQAGIEDLVHEKAIPQLITKINEHLNRPIA